MHLIDFRLVGGGADAWACTFEPLDDIAHPDWIAEAPARMSCIRCSGFNIETAPLQPVVQFPIDVVPGTPDSPEPMYEARLACGHTAWV